MQKCQTKSSMFRMCSRCGFGASRALKSQQPSVIWWICPTFLRAAMAFHMIGVSFGPYRICLTAIGGESPVSITHS